MKKGLLLCALALCLNSCLSSDNDFDNGKRQLESMGYTEVINTGYNAFCCSDEDSFSTGFRALDKDGNTVEGCFCSAFGKGVTIRFE